MVNIESKKFSIGELESMLASSSHYHKIYALKVLTACLTRESNLGQDSVFTSIFNQNKTNFVNMLNLIGATHSKRQDFKTLFVQLYLAILKFAFENGKQQEF